MEPITVQEILTAVDGRLLGELSDPSITVARVDTDSRNIHPGSLFIPLAGERFDGHAFIQAALEGGAAGCLTARERPSYLPGKFYIKVGNTQRALRDLARWYKSRFSIPFVGITGSVGKTTTKDMVAAVLGEHYKVLKTEGNFNNEVGLPLTLLRLDHTHEIGVLEMGMNHFGEIDYLSAIVEPDVVMITNIGDSHIEHLGSRENIFKAKCEIFNHMKKDGLAILNGDDLLLTTLRAHPPCRTVWCGRGVGFEYRAVGVSGDGESLIRCKVITPHMSCDVEIPALGSHMIYPALMAAAAGEAFGLTQEEIVRGILHFAPTKMRMNILRRGDGITILNDAYNANPQSMRAAAAVLGDARDRRRVAVVGDMKELGTNSVLFHQAVGGYFAQAGTDRLIAIGDLARHIAEGAKAAGLEQASYYPSLEQAQDALLRELRAGVTILVKASRSMAFEKIVDFLLAHAPQ